MLSNWALNLRSRSENIILEKWKLIKMTRYGVYYCSSRIFLVLLFQEYSRIVLSYPFEDKHGHMTGFNLMLLELICIPSKEKPLRGSVQLNAFPSLTMTTMLQMKDDLLAYFSRCTKHGPEPHHPGRHI